MFTWATSRQGRRGRRARESSTAQGEAWRLSEPAQAVGRPDRPQGEAGKSFSSDRNLSIQKLGRHPCVNGYFSLELYHLFLVSETKLIVRLQEVDDTWKQINDLVSQGVQAGSIAQAYSLLQDKIQKLQQMGKNLLKTRTTPAASLGFGAALSKFEVLGL